MNPKLSVAFDRSVGRWFYPVHRRLYELTGGLIGRHSGIGPILLLTTTGRRSGRERTTPLLFMPDEENFVVVGSNGGRDQPPAWLLNLQAEPAARVQVGRERVSVRAEILRGEAKEGLWQRVTAFYRGWAHYQLLTSRELPVVRLLRTPRATASDD